MREIKFRVWDKNIPTYSEVMEDKQPSGQMVSNMDYIINSDYFKHALEGRYYLMQFTGLKDKNGKEVFEGDIMPYHFNEKVKGIVKFGSYTNPCDDKHSSHIGFYLEFTNERERELYRKDLGYWIKTTYVEGNIYENPELLNN